MDEKRYSDQFSKDDLVKPVNRLIDEVSKRPSSDGKYLSEYESRYLLQNDPGSDNPGSKEKDISEKIDCISIRLKRLIEDITILEYSNALNDLDRNWEMLQEIDKQERKAIRYLHRRDTKRNKQDSAFQLGFDIGIILSSLTGRPPVDNRGDDFLSGLLYAYETKKEPEEFEVSNNLPELQEALLGIEQDRDEILEKYNIRPTNFTSKMIYNAAHGMAVVEGGVTENPSERKIQNKIQKYIEENLGEEFGRCSFLRSKLDQEWESIKDASTTGGNVTNILEVLWDNHYHKDANEKMTAEEISNELGKEDFYSDSIVQALNRLASEEGDKNQSPEGKKTYKGTDIVRYASGGWTFTDYGYLFAYYVYESERDPEWIQCVGAGGELHHDTGKRYSDEEENILDDGLQYFYKKYKKGEEEAEK